MLGIKILMYWPGQHEKKSLTICSFTQLLIYSTILKEPFSCALVNQAGACCLGFLFSFPCPSLQVPLTFLLSSQPYGH
jgi:hypothetical protein